jgi:hypothetical protein
MWSSGQPAANGGNCGLIDLSLNGSLANSDCSANYSYICRLSKYTLLKEGILKHIVFRG